MKTKNIIYSPYFQKVVNRRNITYLVSLVASFYSLLAYFKDFQGVVVYYTTGLLLVALLVAAILGGKYLSEHVNINRHEAFFMLISATLIILIILGLWAYLLLPITSKYLLNHFGRTTTAQVSDYRFRHYGYITAHPKHLSVKVTYLDHKSYISVDTSNPAYEELLKAQRENHEIKVRYLPLIPKWARPQVEIDDFNHKPLSQQFLW